MRDVYCGQRIVSLAKRVNPNINFIIKYPNWYESYQATGYNPGMQKDVFDMVYTGTETREPFYLFADPKWSLICYDNETFCLHSFRPMLSHAQVVVRGECSGIADTETGKIYENGCLLPRPRRKDDAASTRTAMPEYAFDIAVEPDRSMYLQVIRPL